MASYQHWLLKTKQEFIKPNSNEKNVSCEKSCITEEYLKKHIECVHENLKKHKCNNCKYASNDLGYLKRHIKSCLKKVKRDTKCEFCDKTFIFLSRLNEHIKDVHNRCEYFSQNQNYSRIFKKKIFRSVFIAYFELRKQTR